MAQVSVVIPLYNKEPYVARCLGSVLAQTFSDYEVIVVDDGSTDGSAEVALRFQDDKVRIFRQENAGPGAARNRGVQESRGELIAFLDADDEWHPQFLERMVDFLRRWPQAGIVGSQWIDVATGAPSRVPMLEPLGGSEGIIANYFGDAVCPPILSSSSVVVRRSVLEDVGGFMTEERLGEDLELWARIALRYPVGYVAAPLAYYHREAEGRACEASTLQPYPPVVRFLQRAMARGGLSEDRLADIREYCYRWLIHYASNLHARGKGREARRILWRDCRPTRRFRRQRLRALAVACLPTGLRTWLRGLRRRVSEALKGRFRRAGSG